MYGDFALGPEAFVFTSVVSIILPIHLTDHKFVNLLIINEFVFVVRHHLTVVLEPFNVLVFSVKLAFQGDRHANFGHGLVTQTFGEGNSWIYEYRQMNTLMV